MSIAGTGRLIQGTVYSRSSKPSFDPEKEPPGEAKVLPLNRKRRDRILQATGWQDVLLGTLNLRVEANVVPRLWSECECAIFESAQDVTYPTGFEHIPAVRDGWLYYRGRVIKGNDTIGVLFRRGCNPLPEVVEVFAETKLRDRLDLSCGDTVLCEVD